MRMYTSERKESAFIAKVNSSRHITVTCERRRISAKLQDKVA